MFVCLSIQSSYKTITSNFGTRVASRRRIHRVGKISNCLGGLSNCILRFHGLQGKNWQKRGKIWQPWFLQGCTLKFKRQWRGLWNMYESAKAKTTKAWGYQCLKRLFPNLLNTIQYQCTVIRISKLNLNFKQDFGWSGIC